MVLRDVTFDPVLKNITFELPTGSICCILGENGSGKSTLLKLISGYLGINFRGEILLNNIPLKEYQTNELSSTRTVLSQNNETSSNILCDDYLSITANKYNENFEAIKEKICTQINIKHLLNKELNHCSGGEKQRMHLARIFLTAETKAKNSQHKYILLDEPFNALDIKNIPQVIKYIKYLQEKNFTILVILHEINLAYNLCDQILFLKNGSVVDFGTKEKVFHKENLKKTFNIDFQELTLDNQKSFMPIIT
jgi:iron complex transport system ATP-binding protein